MTEKKLVPRSLWRDKTPAGNKTSPEHLPMRRVVEVKHVDSNVFINGSVTGISFWQALREGEWVAVRGRRHTSILRLSFLSKFEHIRGPEASA